MTDPLGASQVLPYLQGLARRGHRIWLVSCEKPGADEKAWADVRSLCDQAGIEWHPLGYHARPPLLSTLWDIQALRRKAFALQRSVGFDLVHCRSYVPALVGLRLKRRSGVRFLFDMRGFWPEEKVEGGSWRLSNPLFRAVYRYFKARESDFFREADAIVSLTRAARDEMLARPRGSRPARPITVIPCCVDFDHFTIPSADQRLEARQELGLARDAPVLAYLGSLGGIYMMEEMLQFFAAFRERKSDGRFLFITRTAPDFIRGAAERLGIVADVLAIRPASRDEVPRFLAAADLGISFIRATFSKTASSPTKLAEMMAVGLPMVVNAGLGDVDAVMADTRSGVVVDRFDRPSLLAAVDQIDCLRLAPDEIRAGAQRWFRLQEGIAAYDSIYRSLELVSQT
jgi:glycosyltransferase involved in cell wall biosynthesis